MPRIERLKCLLWPGNIEQQLIVASFSPIFLIPLSTFLLLIFPPSLHLRYHTTFLLDNTPDSDQVTERVRFAYALPAQPAGGEDQENLQVADTEDMSVEQLAEQLKNLKQS